MKDEIVKRLKEIEQSEGVKVLYAVESGSRAWGFESQDSDYDIRFVYVRPLNWYLAIDDRRDVLEFPLDGLLDFSGWDMRKALQLFRKSNRAIFEWLVSPTIYMEEGDFAKDLRLLMPRFHSQQTSIAHFLHMAKGNYRTYLQRDEVRVKKYFYVLRPVFACMWLEKHETPPPMEFQRLLEELDLDETLRVLIAELLQRKKAGEELDWEKKIPEINDFLEEQMTHFEKLIKTIQPKSLEDDEVLNEIFRREVRGF